MSEEQVAVKEEKKTRGVKAEEFTEFKGQVMGMFEQLMKKMDSQPKVSVPDSTPAAADEGGPDKNQVTVPPAWRDLVLQILGPEFDCEYVLPPDGGQLFKILVPREKSNATKEYWANFHKDVRTRELGNTGVRGVKEWCLKVRQNLLRSEIKLPVYP